MLGEFGPGMTYLGALSCSWGAGAVASDLQCNRCKPPKNVLVSFVRSAFDTHTHLNPGVSVCLRVCACALVCAFVFVGVSVWCLCV